MMFDSCIQLSETHPLGSSAKERKGAVRGQEQGRKHRFFLQPCQLKSRLGMNFQELACFLASALPLGHLHNEASPRSDLVAVSHSKLVFSWITFLNQVTAPAHRCQYLHKGTRQTLRGVESVGLGQPWQLPCCRATGSAALLDWLYSL